MTTVLSLEYEALIATAQVGSQSIRQLGMNVHIPEASLCFWRQETTGGLRKTTSHADDTVVQIHVFHAQRGCLTDSQPSVRKHCEKHLVCSGCLLNDRLHLFFGEISLARFRPLAKVQLFPLTPNLPSKNQLHHTDDISDRLAAKFVGFPVFSH